MVQQVLIPPNLPAARPLVLAASLAMPHSSSTSSTSNATTGQSGHSMALHQHTTQVVSIVLLIHLYIALNFFL